MKIEQRGDCVYGNDKLVAVCRDSRWARLLVYVMKTVDLEEPQAAEVKAIMAGRK